MLHVTESATAHLRRIRQARGVEDQQPTRITRGPNGLQLTFPNTAPPDDEQVKANGLLVSVAADINPSLADRVLDVRELDGRPRLILHGPPAAATQLRTD